MTLHTLPPPRAVAATADERWAQWTDRGVQNDRLMHGRIVALAVVFTTGLIAWLVLAGLIG